MRYLLDTNIILAYFKENEVSTEVERLYTPFNTPNIGLISVISAGEIKAIAYKNRWGRTKLEKLELLLGEFTTVGIHAKTIVNRYAEINAYSQGKWSPPLPVGMSARNMGKNDLWIAATASIVQAKLITTDRDFDHLHNVFVEVITI
ncbi:MAG: PIN domain-containing protein [Microscillaceae bacterium]|nr:PIN domain-containing protein [Microscillaceae bacterium]